MLVIIIPYRNRESHLHNLIECIYYRFREKNIPVMVIISEQANNNPFNVGKSRNVGFDMAMKILKSQNKTTDGVVFNDVDNYPETELASEAYIKPVNRGFINHIYGRIFCLGGIFKIHCDDFINSNGYPNDFERWGGDDCLLEGRIYDIGVRRENNNVVFERHEGINIKEESEHFRDMVNRDENERKTHISNSTGLIDLSYTIKNIEYTLREPNISIYHLHSDF